MPKKAIGNKQAKSVKTKMAMRLAMLASFLPATVVWPGLVTWRYMST